MAKPYYVIGSRLRHSNMLSCEGLKVALALYDWSGENSPLVRTPDATTFRHDFFAFFDTCKHLIRPPATQIFFIFFQHIVTHSDDEIVGEAEKAALVAVDHVLVAPKDDASDKKVFNELEGVDKAVTTACSGVIRALLQVCLCYVLTVLWFVLPCI